MTTLATLVVRLTGDISDYEKKMSQAEGKLSSVGSAMRSAGQGLTLGLTAPLVAAGGAAVHFANQFNSGLANVASLSEEAAAKVGEWKPMLQDMAVSVGKSTSDLTGGLYQVVSAFGVADDSLQVLEINARAAAAGLSTTEEAIALTSAVTKGYGDTSAAAVQHVADLSLRTVQLGQTTFPELAASMGRVTPLAASLGVSMEEMFGVMATGTGVTGTASEVSTQLRGILQSLMAPTGDMTALMTQYGFANGQAMLESLGLQGTIEAITGAAEMAGIPLQSYIGSIEGQTLAMALAGPQADVFTEKLRAMGDVAGATDAAFAAQTEGVNAVGFSMQQAGIQMEVWAQQIGDVLLPILGSLLAQGQPVVDWITGLLVQFQGLNPETQNWILALVGVAAAAGPVLVILGALVSGIGLLLSPIGLVVAAVVALGVAWAMNWGGIQEKTQAVIDFIVPLVNGAIAGIRAWWAENGDGILAKAGEVWNGIKVTVETVVGVVQGIVSAALGAIQGWWAAHGAAVQTIVSALWNYLVNLVQVNLALLKLAVDGALAGIAQFWQQHGDGVMQIVDLLWSFIKTTFDVASRVVTGIIEAWAALITGDWEKLQSDLLGIAQAIWDEVVAIFETAVGIVATIIVEVVEAIKRPFVDMDWGSLGRAVVDGIANAITDTAGKIAEAAKSAAQRALDAAKSLLGIHSPSTVAAAEIGEPISEGVALGIENAAGKVRAAMGHLADGVMIEGSEQFASIAEQLGKLNPIFELIDQLRELDTSSSVEGPMLWLNYQMLVMAQALRAGQVAFGSGGAETEAYAKLVQTVVKSLVDAAEAVGLLRELDTSVSAEPATLWLNYQMLVMAQAVRAGAVAFGEWLTDETAKYAKMAGETAGALADAGEAVTTIAGLDTTGDVVGAVDFVVDSTGYLAVKLASSQVDTSVSGAGIAEWAVTEVGCLLEIEEALATLVGSDVPGGVADVVGAIENELMALPIAFDVYGFMAADALISQLAAAVPVVADLARGIGEVASAEISSQVVASLRDVAGASVDGLAQVQPIGGGNTTSTDRSVNIQNVNLPATNGRTALQQLEALR